MKHFEVPEMTVRAMQLGDVLTTSMTVPTVPTTTAPTTAPTTTPTTNPSTGDIILPPDTF